jgi:error-prone DNA polymerase
MTAYAELAASSNFSFLRGASHPEELVAEAFRLGHAGIGIADRNTVAGVVRAHVAWRETGARESGFRLAVGARLVFSDDTPGIIAYPSSREGWGRLCRLLTLGRMRAQKGDCILHLDDLLSHLGDLLLIVMPPARIDGGFAGLLARLHEAAPGSLWLAASMTRRGGDRRWLAELDRLADVAGIPLIAVNDVLYHAPDRRPLQDVMTCIREHVTIMEAGRRLEANAERHLKPPARWRGCSATRRRRSPRRSVARSIAFSLDELRYEYPDEPVPPGSTPQSHLEALTWAGAAERFPAASRRRLR